MEIIHFLHTINHCVRIFIVFSDTPVEATVEIGANNECLLPIPVTTSLSLPSTPGHLTSMRLLNSYPVRACPESVCCYQQNIFVGLKGSVDRISESGQVQPNFLTVDGYCSSLKVWNDKLYLLVCDNENTCKVQEHSISGKLIKSWNTSIGYIDFNKHSVVDGKIIIPDPTNKRLVVYNRAGRPIKHIPCPWVTGDCIAMAIVGDSTLVVSIRNEQMVLRINIDNGEVIWKTEHIIRCPLGVVCLKNRFVLVHSQDTEPSIHILALGTGKRKQLEEQQE